MNLKENIAYSRRIGWKPKACTSCLPYLKVFKNHLHMSIFSYAVVLSCDSSVKSRFFGSSIFWAPWFFEALFRALWERIYQEKCTLKFFEPFFQFAKLRFHGGTKGHDRILGSGLELTRKSCKIVPVLYRKFEYDLFVHTFISLTYCPCFCRTAKVI